MGLGLENFERDGWMDGLGGNVGKITNNLISFFLCTLLYIFVE